MSNGWGLTLLAGAAWFFPIGAFVMRRHFVDATGGMRVAKIILIALAMISLPFAIYYTGIIVILQAIDTMDSVYRMVNGIG